MGRSEKLIAWIEAAPYRSTMICFFLIGLFRIMLVQLVPISFVVDEATWAQASHWFWLHGKANAFSGRLPFLFPALFSPLFGLLDFDRASSLAQAFNALIVTAAIFPIRSLARLFLPEVAAIGVAAISVSGVPGTYAAVLMPESLFFLLFWLFLASFGPLVLKPTLSGAAMAILAGAALLATKPHSLPVVLLVLAALAAATIFRRKSSPGGIFPKPTVWRAFAVLAVVLCLGLLLVWSATNGPLFGAYSFSVGRVLKGPLSLAQFLQQLIGNATLLCLAVGVVPVTTLFLLRPAQLTISRPQGKSLILLTLAALPPVYLVLASHYGTLAISAHLHERHLYFVYPSVFILAAFLWSRYDVKSPIVASVLIGLAFGLLLWIGLTRYPTPYVLEIVASPTRAALVSGTMFDDDSANPAARAGSLAAASCVGAALATAGALLPPFRGRLGVTGVATVALGLLITMAQIRWSAEWATEHHEQSRAESVIVPQNAALTVISDNVDQDTLLLEKARRGEHCRILAFGDLSIDPASGFLTGLRALDSDEEYWVTPARILLRNEAVYRAHDFQIYRVKSNPRLLAKIAGLSRDRTNPHVEIEYYPPNPFLDNVAFVFQMRSNPQRLGKPPVELEVSDGAQLLRKWVLGPADDLYHVSAVRPQGAPFRIVMDIRGCSQDSSDLESCYHLTRLFTRDADAGGQALDELHRR